MMLGALCMLMMSAFLLFDSDFSSPVAENRTIFAVLSAMLVTILQHVPLSPFCLPCMVRWAGDVALPTAGDVAPPPTVEWRQLQRMPIFLWVAVLM